jgi:HrpA-like RNA helicase
MFIFVTDDHYTKVREERLQLPIRPARNRLIHQVQKHNSVIIIGETGSGKTTQIPQVNTAL